MRRACYLIALLLLVLATVFIGYPKASPVLAATFNLVPADNISLDFGFTGDKTSSVANIVASTDDTGMNTVSITVKDEKTNNPGFLTLGGVDSPSVVKLTNELRVKGGDAASFTDLTFTGVALGTNKALSSLSYTINDFQVHQTITTEDLSLTAGNYSLMMTFTATFSP